MIFDVYQCTYIVAKVNITRRIPIKNKSISEHSCQVVFFWNIYFFIINGETTVRFSVSRVIQINLQSLGTFKIVR